MGVMNVGVTALNAFRAQLTTTSHNVANVNTEGYTRQVVQLGTQVPSLTGEGYIGNGVKIQDVTRQFDQFLADRMRVYTSSSNESSVYLDRASRIDNILADPDAGLSSALQGFFNSVQDVADDPSSVTTRDVLLSNASILADRFDSVFNFMESMRTEVNQDVRTLVDQVNRYAENISQVNAAIQATTGNGSANDLLDKRDQLVTELSELVSVNTVLEDSGAMNVFIGNGQGLVIGTNTFELSAEINENEPDRVDVYLNSGGTPFKISDSLNGGKIGGYLRFRQEILDPAENALGRLATGLAYAFNEQHQLGMDLNGQLGNNFFTIPEPPDSNDPYVQQMVASLDGTGSVEVIALNPAELDTSDYEITLLSTGWKVISRESQQLVTFDGSVPNQISFDGVTVDVSSAVVNDKFVIRPTRLASRAFDVALNDARQIAAAGAMSVSNGDQIIDPPTLNAGTAAISEFQLIDRFGHNVALPAAITITYDNSVSQFNVSAPGYTVTPVALSYDPANNSGNVYSFILNNGGVEGDVFEYGFKINGTPANADVFTFQENTGAVSDNSNGLRLAALQTAKTMRNTDATIPQPTSSFTDLYSSMIGNVGSQTRQAMVNNETQSRLLEQATASYDEVSGVNLDEEAANLVHFQQAYQAATQVIRVSNQLFDTLLNSI